MFSSAFITPQALAKTPSALALLFESQTEGVRCLHTSTEINAAEFENEADDVFTYLLVHDANDARRAPVGLFGAEIGDDIRRAWLRGPFVLAQKQHRFAAIADAALDALRVRVGERVDTFDAYIETSHTAALRWYESRGFVPLKRHNVYTIDAPTHDLSALSDVQPLASELVDQTTALAARAFPGGYLTRENFAAPPTDERLTLCLRDGDTLLGYVYMSYEPASMEAQVDNLAVLESARRKGYARKLLLAGLHWAFTLRKAPRAALVVTEGNINAEQLYQSVGFQSFAKGQHLRLNVRD
jgi:ribosomal protein S18 acetylase RimI-like enzyme